MDKELVKFIELSREHDKAVQDQVEILRGIVDTQQKQITMLAKALNIVSENILPSNFFSDEYVPVDSGRTK